LTCDSGRVGSLCKHIMKSDKLGQEGLGEPEVWVDGDAGMCRHCCRYVIVGGVGASVRGWTVGDYTLSEHLRHFNA